MNILYVPFALQGVVMMVDEFYFHERRGLPRWERLGHPLDTLTVIAVYLYVLTMPYDKSALNIFLGLAAFSCFFITKDEFVHAENCSAMEHWLHAMLFVLHPLNFFIAGYLWSGSYDLIVIEWQIAVISIFLLYQIIRWSVPWKFSKR
jgi:hypothetical protein